MSVLRSAIDPGAGNPCGVFRDEAGLQVKVKVLFGLAGIPKHLSCREAKEERAHGFDSPGSTEGGR